MNSRGSRYSRKQSPDTMVLQPRDREIMAGVYSYRVLTSGQVQRLFGFGCARKANNRLRKLFDGRFLDRSFLPTTRGSGKALYYLGPRGATVVAKELGLDILSVKKKMKTISQLKDFFLNHSLELNDLRINLTKAIEDQPAMRLERWINDNDCEQTYRAASSQGEITSRFRPDGYFRFFFNDKLYSCFLELDRSTMSLERFKKKVQTYLDFARLGYYERRFGVKYFRVLVVAPSIIRLNNLKQAVEQVTDKAFWFTTIDQTTEKKFLRPIWRRVGHDGSYGLVSANIGTEK